MPLPAIRPRLWPPITRRESPPSTLPRQPACAAAECGLSLVLDTQKPGSITGRGTRAHGALERGQIAPVCVERAGPLTTGVRERRVGVAVRRVQALASSRYSSSFAAWPAHCHGTSRSAASLVSWTYSRGSSRCTSRTSTTSTLRGHVDERIPEGGNSGGTLRGFPLASRGPGQRNRHGNEFFRRTAKIAVSVFDALRLDGSVAVVTGRGRRNRGGPSRGARRSGRVGRMP